MQNVVSVIVPIYHGGKYIQGLITQIEEGAEGIPDYKVELVFIMMIRQSRSVIHLYLI